MNERTNEYLVAGENDILDLGDVGLGHAREYGRKMLEVVEGENEHEETSKNGQLLGQRSQVIVVQVQLLQTTRKPPTTCIITLANHTAVGRLA